MNSDITDTHAVTIKSLQKIINFIEENILEELTPAFIARHFFLSVSSMNVLFKVICDIAVMEYVRNRRLTLAGEELKSSDVRIIDLAYKYRYETPEAFAKAFSRFHGFPPSFVRRIYPEIRMFHPILIELEIKGGWLSPITSNIQKQTTEMKSLRPEIRQENRYINAISLEGGTGVKTHKIFTRNMVQKEDWNILLSLTKKLEAEGISYKVDGGTMVFAHGLEFKLEKICLTFKWSEEQRLLNFFGHTGKADTSYRKGFKYFDVMFEGMKIRCMFFGNCMGDDTDDFLYKNTDLVDVDGQVMHVQTLEFYLENAEPKGNDEFYQMVNQWVTDRNNRPT